MLVFTICQSATATTSQEEMLITKISTWVRLEAARPPPLTFQSLKTAHLSHNNLLSSSEEIKDWEGGRVTKSCLGF